MSNMDWWSDEHGETALHHICRRRDAQTVVRLLAITLLTLEGAPCSAEAEQECRARAATAAALDHPSLAGYTPRHFMSPEVEELLQRAQREHVEQRKAGHKDANHR